MNHTNNNQKYRVMRKRTFMRLDGHYVGHAYERR